MKSSLLSTRHAISHCQPAGSVAIGGAWGMGVGSGSLSNPATAAKPEQVGEFNPGGYGLSECSRNELTIHPIQRTSNLDRSTQSGRSRPNPAST